MSETYKIRGTKVTSPYPVQLTPGETRLIFSLERIFPEGQIFADYYLPKLDRSRQENLVSHANLAQIDCIVADQRGIFVFESKDYSGWIYGHGGRRHWTQVLDFGREKNQFYNPIWQNQTHIEALSQVISNVNIHSIIVFGRETTLKVIEDVPNNCCVCTQASLRAVLQPWNQNILSPTEVENISQQLRAACVHPTALVRAEHIDEIK